MTAVRDLRSPRTIAAAQARRAAAARCTHWIVAPTSGYRAGHRLYLCLAPDGCRGKVTLGEVDRRIRAAAAEDALDSIQAASGGN